MSAIVIVEDEAHLAQGLRFNLEADGHEVTLFDNGEAALEHLLVTDRNTDAVILDVMLPGVDGFDIARDLRKAGRLYPTALSRAARLEGTGAWLNGKTARAQVLWQRALELARTWRMPTDEGLAHYELARTAEPGGTRELHLTRARHIFEHLGATGSLRALEALEPPLLPAPAKASAL